MARKSGKQNLLAAASKSKPLNLDQDESYEQFNQLFETTPIIEVESLGAPEEPEIITAFKKDVDELPQIGKDNEIDYTRKPTTKMVSTETVTSDIFTNEELTREVTGQYDGEVVTARKKGKEFKARYSIGFEFDSAEISLSRSINPYDREVYDALVSLYASGNQYVSEAMIYRAMHLEEKNTSVGETAIEEIAASLRKMVFTKISIDMTDEAVAFQNLEGRKYDGYLLAAIKGEYTYKGVTAKYWKILDEPILLHYAKLKGQVFLLPKTVVSVKSKKARSKKSTVIQGYLTYRIVRMYKNKNISNNILLEPLYEYVARMEDKQDYVEKKVNHNTRKTVEKLLEEWKKVNFIAGYEWKKASGNKIRSVEITIPDKNVTKLYVK